LTQYYKMPGFSLANANASTKVLITAFLLTVLAGLGVALLQYADRAGASGRGAVEWVRGNEDEARPVELKSPKTYRELLSITHEHAFALPILLFVLLHLNALTTIPEGAKIALYVAGFGSYALALGAPWLIKYASPGFTSLLIPSGIVMASTIAGSTLLSLFEIWLAGPLRRLRGRPEPPSPDPLVRRNPKPE
jgi:hypothetical protein